jgi:hypothetical protein
MMKWIRWITLWLLLESPNAFAGQLHHSYLELKDIPAQAGYAVAVIVTLVNAARRNIRLQLRVKQHWGTLPATLASPGEIEGSSLAQKNEEIEAASKNCREYGDDLV